MNGWMNGWIRSHNTHRTIWNTPAAKQGEHLEGFARKMDLDILPIDPKENMRISNRGVQSTLDYFMHKNIALGPQTTSATITGSDHRAITTHILHCKKSSKKKGNDSLVCIRPRRVLQEDPKARHAYRDELINELPA